MPGLDDYARENYENEIKELQHVVAMHIGAKADTEKRLAEVLDEVHERNNELQRLQNALKFEQQAHKESNKIGREQLDKVRGIVGFTCQLLRTMRHMLTEDEAAIDARISLIETHLFNEVSSEYHHSDIPF